MRVERLSILVFIILIFSTVLEEVNSYSTNESSVIRVPDDYLTIQDAIDAAKSGDTIIVGPGVYYETLYIDKPLSLMGENRENTIIIGSGHGSVIYISSDNVLLKGFTVKGSGNNYIGPFDGGDAGIILNSCKRCILSDLVATGNCIGIFLNTSDGNIIKDNIVYSNSRDGIRLRMSNRNVIIRNNATLNGGHGGIYLNPYSSYNLIAGNTCGRNADHGIKLQDSSNHNILRNNLLIDNENAGIFLRKSDYNILYNNTCIGNRHNPGIILYISCDNNIIAGNTCISNDEGISIQHSSNGNWLVNNFCLDNRVRGILLWSSSSNILVNNIIKWNGKDPYGTAGIYISDSSQIKIYYNNISMNWRGIVVEGDSFININIHYNNIMRNIEWGL